MRTRRHLWILIAVGLLSAGGCASVPRRQTAAAPVNVEPEIIQVNTGQVPYEKVWLTTNTVLSDAFARLMVDREGGVIRSEVTGRGITEWLFLEKESLKVTCVVSKNPVALYLKLEGETKQGDKWIPREPVLKEKTFFFNLTQELERCLRYE